MEASTTIRQMLAGNKIFVPTYQRAYSWDTTELESNSPKQINVFFSDLEDHNKSLTESLYYFGHFLFEKKEEDKKFGVVDGQQRMTTIVIFLSALFKRLKQIRPLNENEQETFEDIIKRNSTYRFETVDYDKQLFKDYVIDQIKEDQNGLETVSAKRIVTAFDFFGLELADKDEVYLLKMLDVVQNASCTTHFVESEAEAIQMFIFQNNRGKKPSNLEIIKAQFMFNVHLYGGKEKEALIEEIKNRFEKIYKSISSIEYRIKEDDVLSYTLCVHFNSLWVDATKVDTELLKDTRIDFIKNFTWSLATSFEHLTSLLVKDERESIAIHSLVSLGSFYITMPFMIKAYTFGLQSSQINLLCSKLESMILRHRLIGTRADMTSRLNGIYQEFTSENKDTKPIIDKIEWMKTIPSDWRWWAYWNDEALERSLQGQINHSTAKYLLWKYENYLIQQGQEGYPLIRFDEIEKPHLEHIAPQTENGEQEASGYCKYDEDFRNCFVDCIGNYLLLSAPHNEFIGNKSFVDVKRPTYTQLQQQREIRDMTEEPDRDRIIWDKEKITMRKERIIKFVMDNF